MILEPRDGRESSDHWGQERPARLKARESLVAAFQQAADAGLARRGPG